MMTMAYRSLQTAGFIAFATTYAKGGGDDDTVGVGCPAHFYGPGFVGGVALRAAVSGLGTECRSRGIGMTVGDG